MVKRNTPKLKISNGVYLDYAASTPIDHKVLGAMMPYLRGRFGNPGSIHLWGQEAQIAIDKARIAIAEFLGCSAGEIIFTGSATEADNFALKGVIFHLLERGFDAKHRPHIITSQIEHKAVLEPCHWLEAMGFAEATYLPVDKEGIVRIADIKKAMRDNTVLVSIMYANNEIGTIQPVKEIGALIKKINQSRFSNPKSKIRNPKQIPNSKFQIPKIYFHSDAVQAVNYLDCNVDKLGVDLLTLSGHKIYGPKGIGLFYVRKSTPIGPLIHGGGQEYDLRAGTENVAGIVGLGEAVQQTKNQKPKTKNILKLRNKLIERILKNISGARLNGSGVKRLPNNVNISFKGAEGESIVIALDQQGVAVSTGSACSAKALTPSHVIMALTGSEEVAHSSIRFSLGKQTTEKDINYVLKILPGIIARLRKISGYKL